MVKNINEQHEILTANPANPDAGNAKYFIFDDAGTIKLRILEDDGTTTDLSAGAGSYTFDAAADTGTAETVSNGDTLTIAGGTGVSTSVAATDTVTVDMDINELTAEATVDGAADYLPLYDASAGAIRKVLPNNLPSSGGGEANTASNVGTAGVGVFKQKSGVDLEFKNINAGSNKIGITDDTLNDEVDIDVNEGNLTLDNIGGTLSISKGGTGSTTASAARTALSAAPNSPQYLTLATDSELTNERTLNPIAGIGATDNGANGSYDISANIGSGTIKTISAGAVAVGNDRNIIVAAEAGTTDDLIEVTGLSVGDEVYLRADTGDTITVKHNDAGATIKILLYGDADVTLDEQNPLRLVYVDTNVLAEAVDQNSGGGGGGTPSFNAGAYTPPSDYTTTSTTYVDVDGTNVKETVTVASGDTIEATLHIPHVYGSAVADVIFLRLVAGSTATDDALEFEVTGTNSPANASSIVMMGTWTGLGAGTFDFKPQWKVNAGDTGNIDAGLTINWMVKVYS